MAPRLVMHGARRTSSFERTSRGSSGTGSGKCCPDPATLPPASGAPSKSSYLGHDLYSACSASAAATGASSNSRGLKPAEAEEDWRSMSLPAGFKLGELSVLSSRAVEREEKRLNELETKTQPLEVRLGKALAKKNMRAIEWLRSWDSNGDGVVSFDEFKYHISALGIEASESELDTLFRGLDEDGSGTLELNELKPALRSLQSMAAAQDKEVAQVREAVAMLQQRAAQAQVLLAAIEEAEAEEARLVQDRDASPLVVKLADALINRGGGNAATRCAPTRRLSRFTRARGGHTSRTTCTSRWAATAQRSAKWSSRCASSSGCSATRVSPLTARQPS